LLVELTEFALASGNAACKRSASKKPAGWNEF